jgi:hypothetical protein
LTALHGFRATNLGENPVKRDAEKFIFKKKKVELITP